MNQFGLILSSHAMVHKKNVAVISFQQNATKIPWIANQHQPFARQEKMHLMTLKSCHSLESKKQVFKQGKYIKRK